MTVNHCVRARNLIIDKALCRRHSESYYGRIISCYIVFATQYKMPSVPLIKAHKSGVVQQIHKIRRYMKCCRTFSMNDIISFDTFINVFSSITAPFYLRLLFLLCLLFFLLFCTIMTTVMIIIATITTTIIVNTAVLSLSPFYSVNLMLYYLLSVHYRLLPHLQTYSL